MSTAQTQLQADLQRKHAEIQTLIGQQQAELRRVSEQLLMARLGLLSTNQTEPAVNVSKQIFTLHSTKLHDFIVTVCFYTFCFIRYYNSN